MTELEKTIKSLEICAVVTKSCAGCPSNDQCKGVSNAAMLAAIKLLKKMEPVKPAIGGNRDYESTRWYICPECQRIIDYKDAFCRYCGRAVKWDAAD